MRLPVINHHANLLHTLFQVGHGGTVAKPHEVNAFALSDSAGVPRVDIEKYPGHNNHLRVSGMRLAHAKSLSN